MHWCVSRIDGNADFTRYCSDLDGNGKTREIYEYSYGKWALQYEDGTWYPWYLRRLPYLYLYEYEYCTYLQGLGEQKREIGVK